MCCRPSICRTNRVHYFASIRWILFILCINIKLKRRWVVFWPSRSSAHAKKTQKNKGCDFAKKRKWNHVCEITFLSEKGSFSYLLQISTTMRKCVVCKDFGYWLISWMSSAHDFARKWETKACPCRKFSSTGVNPFILPTYSHHITTFNLDPYLQVLLRMTLQSTHGFVQNGTINCTVTFFLLEWSFSYLLQIFTSKRICVVYNNFPLTHIFKVICWWICPCMGQRVVIVG